MPEPAPALPESLVAYLLERDNQRADAVTAFLASLTDRERALVKDVAVMGYVQGLMRPLEGGGPRDGQILTLVVDACLALPDQYPAVNADPGRTDADSEVR
jgi:hypothetical protein